MCGVFAIHSPWYSLWKQILASTRWEQPKASSPGVEGVTMEISAKCCLFMVRKCFEVWCQSTLAAAHDWYLSPTGSLLVPGRIQAARVRGMSTAPHKFCAIDIFGGRCGVSFHHTSYTSIPNFINQNWNGEFLVTGYKPILVVL